jgi:hypothetical protein
MVRFLLETVTARFKAGHPPLIGLARFRRLARTRRAAL